MERTHIPLVNIPKKKKAKKPIRKVANKRAKVNRAYMEIRAQFLKDHPICQWWISEHGYTEDMGMITGGPYAAEIPKSTEIHHRARRGINLLNVDTWMAVSREAHLWIHANPKESREKGYLIDT